MGSKLTTNLVTIPANIKSIRIMGLLHAILRTGNQFKSIRNFAFR